MKNKNLLFSNEVTLDDNRMMRLEYNLTENKSADTEGFYYGIQIVRYLDGNTEVGEIRGISYARDKVEEIARILFKHTVTPISMAEIVDDLITLEVVKV